MEHIVTIRLQRVKRSESWCRYNVVLKCVIIKFLSHQNSQHSARVFYYYCYYYYYYYYYQFSPFIKELDDS
jgi:hypothetical protein